MVKKNVYTALQILSWFSIMLLILDVMCLIEYPNDNNNNLVLINIIEMIIIFIISMSWLIHIFPFDLCETSPIIVLLSVIHMYFELQVVCKLIPNREIIFKFFIFPINFHLIGTFNLHKIVYCINIILYIFVTTYISLGIFIFWLLYSFFGLRNIDFPPKYPYITKILKYHLIGFLVLSIICLYYTKFFDILAVISIICFMISNIYLINFFSCFYDYFSDMHINNMIIIFLFFLTSFCLEICSLIISITITNLQPINFVCLIPLLYIICVVCMVLYKIFPNILALCNLCVNSLCIFCYQCISVFCFSRRNYENDDSDDDSDDEIDNRINQQIIETHENI
jgi:hypothetical protein